MNTDEMKQRTKQFALRVIKLAQNMPDDRIAATLGQQLLRSGTSVGANYRAACRARSPAEFRSKLGIVEEEGDESGFWMELLVEAGIMPKQRLENLMNEANEIVAMIVASINTSKKNQ